MKIIYQDVETGGLDPAKSSLLQLSGIVEIDGKVEETFNFFPFPIAGDEPIENEAILIHGLDPNAFPDSFENPESVYNKYINLLDKYINKYDSKDKFYFVGYNCNHFDSPFIRYFLLKNHNQYYGSYFWTPTIDLFILYGYASMGQRAIFKDFKLSTVAEALGVQIDRTKAHDALYDCYITRDLFLEYIKEYPIYHA